MLARVLMALEHGALAQALRRELTREGAVVEAVRAGGRLWERIGREAADLFIVDEDRIPPPAPDSVQALCRLPEAPAVVVATGGMRASGRAELLAAGCAAVLERDLPTDAFVAVLQRLLERRTAVQDAGERDAGLAGSRLSDFVSHSPAMQAFTEMVVRVAGSDTALLIAGETGVGKERLARAIHAESPRAAGPFVAVNCGALAESLLESELFGHEEGAFTGATRARRGCFELAHGGTLFLDEIGEMPAHLQVKLLRVLQDHTVQRVGGERPVRVDARIMAASNRDLEAMIAEGTFRRDLYYRLGVVTLLLPPLRDRREDIPELVQSYLGYLRPRVGRDVTTIRDDALEALVRYDWPGNVRELINVVERAMLLAPGETIRLADLPATVAACADGRAAPEASPALTTAGPPLAAPAAEPDLADRYCHACDTPLRT
ncbi:MAG: sigma-54 interaction domain-containing protein, partial [Planctomycetota bacterium]